MPKYCLDTSAISNPLMAMPEDLYVSVWGKVVSVISSGAFCCTKEISDEYDHIRGNVGDCLRNNKVLHEVGQDTWNWPEYVGHVQRMSTQYKAFISEYNSNRRNTVGLNDLSIVALAKTLQIPVVSMEGSDQGQISLNRMRIPRLCVVEGIDHLDFNEMLRREGGL